MIPESMQNLFDSNLKLLETYDADLAQRLRFHIPTGQVEVFSTPQKLASLRIQKNNTTLLLHSGQDPIREAERWAATLEVSAPYNVMILGCGLFYHVYQLVKRWQSTLQRLVIVEKNWDVIHALFSTISLADYLRNKNTFFLIDPSPAELRTFMNRHITALTLDGLSIIDHPASCSLYPEFYRNIRQVVDECMQGGGMLLRTKVMLGGMIQKNIIRNSPYLFSLPSITVFRNMFPGIPAFIVGAGPSLDRNVDRLADVGEKGIIIAVDTVFQLLRDRGIHPHLVVSTDPTELNAAHFSRIHDVGETILAFSPSVYYKIPQMVKGTKTIFPLPFSRFLSLFSQVRNDSHPLPLGVNVGQTAFNLARFLGCDPLVLVGLDFSFPIEGGTTHASGTALRRKIYSTDSRETMKVELLDEERSLEEFEPIYIPGNTVEKVATNKFWFNYLRSMEVEISKTPSRVINCSEGGAKIEGSEIRCLSATISEVCRKEAQIRGNLHAVVGFFFGEPMTEGIAILEESRTILLTACQYAEQGLQEVSALQTIADSVTPNRTILLEKLDSLHECHKNLVQNHKVYKVLDEAADAILQSFLRRENRPSGDRASLENVQRALDRYRPYFEGMKRLCEEFGTILEETIDFMKSDTNPFPSNWF